MAMHVKPFPQPLPLVGINSPQWPVGTNHLIPPLQEMPRPYREPGMLGDAAGDAAQARNDALLARNVLLNRYFTDQATSATDNDWHAADVQLWQQKNGQGNLLNVALAALNVELGDIQTCYWAAGLGDQCITAGDNLVLQKMYVQAIAKYTGNQNSATSFYSMGTTELVNFEDTDRPQFSIDETSVQEYLNSL